MHRYSTIKDRTSFVRMNSSAARFVVSSFILQMLENPKLSDDEIRVGYTVTKKLGGAVVRNRIKRRLREAVRKTILDAKLKRDYVFIARHKAAHCDFSELLGEVSFAFKRIRTSTK